jgi:hypothetical protein
VKKILILVAAMAMLTGCAFDATGSDPKPTSSAHVPPPADGGRFDTPADLIAKAGSALPCDDARAMTPIGARAQSSCYGGNVVIRIYDDHAGVDQQVEFLGITGGADLLAGENWTLNAPKRFIAAARQKLGGTYVHVKCTKDC